MQERESKKEGNRNSLWARDRETEAKAEGHRKGWGGGRVQTELPPTSHHMHTETEVLVQHAHMLSIVQQFAQVCRAWTLVSLEAGTVAAKSIGLGVRPSKVGGPAEGPGHIPEALSHLHNGAHNTTPLEGSLCTSMNCGLKALVPLKPP